MRVPRNLATKEFDRIKTDFLSIWFELEFEENETENVQLTAVNETPQEGPLGPKGPALFQDGMPGRR